MDLEELLYRGCQELEIEIEKEMVLQLIKYKDILLEWNKKMNLTAIEEPKEIVIKHFLDSLTCLMTKQLTSQGSLIDVGTGAGFPGIPLKVLLPDLKLTLLDALNKRINFLKEVSDQLNLHNITFLHGRAEDYGQNKEHREQYDFAVARAVASMNVLAEYCLPFVKIGGYFICQKGPQLSAELTEAKRALSVLGGNVVDEMTIPLPFSDIKHRIVVIEKVRQTPTKYPRKAGKPSKEPII